MPKVSVILPVYNAEKYLNEAIDSILNQTFTDFELIIINDGSTDNSEKIIDSYNDDRLIKVNNDVNLKLIATLNKGIDLAKGEYIARMDADDISLPERFNKQVKFLDEHKDYVVVGSNYEAFGDESFISNLPTQDEHIRLELFFSNPFAHPSVMMRKEILTKKNIRYQTKYLHMEDLALWFDLSKHGKCSNLSENLLRYRVAGQNISKKNADTHKIRSVVFYYDKLIEFVPAINQNDVEVYYDLIYADVTNFKVRDFKKLINYVSKFLALLFDGKIVDQRLKMLKKKLLFKMSDKSLISAVRLAFAFKYLPFEVLKYSFKSRFSASRN